MKPYVMAEDLYQHKLAVVLGRGKRLNKLLRHYPTEKKFKAASIEEIANIIGIKNRNSAVLQKLKKLDIVYDKMVTFIVDPGWSRKPRARRIMGIDTEYLKSSLDSIQYVIMDGMDHLSSGIIFTNNSIAKATSISEGINLLRWVIEDYQPELIVGHNFNSDISILEAAYGDELPELYFYDDTMELMANSNLANILGSSSLNLAVHKLFDADVIGLFNAYHDLDLLVEYGIKDALYPIYLRYYILNGELPEINFTLKPEKIVQEENRQYLKQQDGFHIKLQGRGG
ncbi:MAG TPA: hypothetical protein GXZ20_08520 [Halanaerobiaceae bacterium]|jgi:hypothetical protein|nr:hypothetical protein [Bacillota bacterium]HHU93159.1 hypothetical protein [Halanaerobiaceae bacterium]HOA40064.1 hypothetical protein [Halanaerobiales bacterium]HPZ62140.1 hypothetical protein [Halanaerobiales bacterium]HQD03363.1 hypothetical protein [Halanaerobiales bacterium]